MKKTAGYYALMHANGASWAEVLKQHEVDLAAEILTRCDCAVGGCSCYQAVKSVLNDDTRESDLDGSSADL